MVTAGGDGRTTDDAAEDAALARRILQTHDADAEQALCRRLLPRIRAWGMKHVRSEAAALDLAQQVLLGVLEALREGRVEDVDRLGPFVLGVCKNTLFSWNRGERRHAALLERFGPSFADVAHIDDCAIDRRRLAGCFDLLDTRARAVLALTFFSEQSGDAISRELGMTVANVRVVRHRALEQLRQCVTGGGP